MSSTVEFRTAGYILAIVYNKNLNYFVGLFQPAKFEDHDGYTTITVDLFSPNASRILLVPSAQNRKSLEAKIRARIEGLNLKSEQNPDLIEIKIRKEFA